MVNTRGNHGLSRKRSADKALKHNYLHNLVYHALLQAGLSLIKKHVGLLSSLMAFPTCLIKLANRLYGISVADALADSYLASTSMSAAAAAEFTATRKKAKYVEHSTKHHFVPLTFESLDSIGSKATNFLKELGRCLTLATDNP